MNSALWGATPGFTRADALEPQLECVRRLRLSGEEPDTLKNFDREFHDDPFDDLRVIFPSEPGVFVSTAWLLRESFMPD